MTESLAPLDNVGFFGVDGARARAYLDRLRGEAVTVSRAVLLGPDAPSPAPAQLFDNQMPVRAALARAGVAITEVDTSDPNSDEAVEALAGCQETVWIFSGPPGCILGERPLGLGKAFLHVHPGWLPDYRGSTTIYYSLLNGDGIGVSALLLDARIDSGPIVARARYPVPQDRTTIDLEYDAYVRADLLATVLARFATTGRFDEIPQSSDEETAYYIVHPVLKHVALYSTMPQREPREEQVTRR